MRNPTVAGTTPIHQDQSVSPPASRMRAPVTRNIPTPQRTAAQITHGIERVFFSSEALLSALAKSPTEGPTELGSQMGSAPTQAPGKPPRSHRRAPKLLRTEIADRPLNPRSRGYGLESNFRRNVMVPGPSEGGVTDGSVRKSGGGILELSGCSVSGGGGRRRRPRDSASERLDAGGEQGSPAWTNSVARRPYNAVRVSISSDERQRGRR